jgi:hypothetical protein
MNVGCESGGQSTLRIRTDARSGGSGASDCYAKCGLSAKQALPFPKATNA